MNVTKAPQEDVETFFRVPCDGDCSEPPEVEEFISESHDDVETAASEFPDYAVEEVLEEKDAKSARSQIIKYEEDHLMIFINILCTRQIIPNI